MTTQFPRKKLVNLLISFTKCVQKMCQALKGNILESFYRIWRLPNTFPVGISLHVSTIPFQDGIGPQPDRLLQRGHRLLRYFAATNPLLSSHQRAPGRRDLHSSQRRSNGAPVDGDEPRAARLLAGAPTELRTGCSLHDRADRHGICTYILSYKFGEILNFLSDVY